MTRWMLILPLAALGSPALAQNAARFPMDQSYKAISISGFGGFHEIPPIGQLMPVKRAATCFQCINHHLDIAYRKSSSTAHTRSPQCDLVTA